MAAIIESESDTEKQAGGNVVAESIDSDGGIRRIIDPAVRKRLVWKTDLILMPALGECTSFVW